MHWNAGVKAFPALWRCHRSRHQILKIRESILNVTRYQISYWERFLLEITEQCPALIAFSSSSTGHRVQGGGEFPVEGEISPWCPAAPRRGISTASCSSFLMNMRSQYMGRGQLINSRGSRDLLASGDGISTFFLNEKRSCQNYAEY
jgi:hypothetical protein